MASLTVRNLDDRIAAALKQRAAKHGRSAEAEHRAILAQVLLQPEKKSFADILASMPNVGCDNDFERLQQNESASDVFS